MQWVHCEHGFSSEFLSSPPSISPWLQSKHRSCGDPHGAEILSFSCCWMEPQQGRGGSWLWGFCCPGVPKLLPASLLRHFGS